MPVRPIINPDAPQIPKRDPQISFTESTIDIDEKYLKGNYTFNWTKYLVNSDNVGYTITLSEGIVFVDEDTIKWSDSGIYTLTLTTIEDKIFNSIDIVLTLNITTLDTSGVEYVPNPLEIVDGDLQIEYFNIEKREGVYMFDLIKPNNPNSLTINYKIEGKNGCTIDLDDAKVHIAKKGKYKITAWFDGNTSYRPSSTVYYLVYGKDGEEDDKDPYNPENPDNPDNPTKKYPNLSFSKSSVKLDKISSNIYEVLQVNNPYSVPITYTSDKGNIFDGNSKIQLEEGFEGNVKITCTSEETATYYSQSVSYVLTIEIPESEKTDEYVFEFIQESDNLTLNTDGEYDILVLNNPLGLEYTLVVSKPAMINSDKTKILCYIDGTYIVTATSIATDTYKSKTASYTLTLIKSDKETPVFSFIKTQDTQQKTEDGKYYILGLDNPSGLEYTLSCNNENARIEDNCLIFNDIDDITITAVSKETDEYVSVSTYYILYIIKSSKQNPNISFTYERINVPFNDDITVGYDIQELNNPNNVVIETLNSSSGTIIDNKVYDITSPAELYIQATSAEDENYYSATARYILNIYKSLLKWPNFRVHDDYSLIDKLDLTKNIELLRWPKDDNLVFDASEWRVSSSKGICVVNNLTMTETEDDCILYADIKFSQEGNARINITFNGNAEWQSANNMGFYINYKKPELLSPDLSFPSYYVIQDKSTNNTYLIQEVLNPYSVPVNYYVSNGILTGNILTYPDAGNVVITCTSDETDIYKSQSVQYTLHINEPKKLSPELSFTNSLEEYEEGTYPNNEYPLQTLNNPHNVPIKEWKATNNAIVYATNGQVVKYNYSGDVIVSVTSRETSVYTSETVYYTLRIVESSSLLDPELYYSPNSGAVYVNSEGIYTIPLPHIADSTLPITFSTENNLGTISSDGTTLSVSGTWNVRIYAKFAGNSTYRAAQADYVLRISEAPEKPYPDIRFLYSTVSGDSNTSNGVYDLQTTFVGAQSDIGGEYFISYNDARVDNSTKKLYYNGTSASIIVYYRTNETSEYKSALLYYDMWISAQPLQYLEGELVQTNIGVSGDYNQQILIPLVLIKKSKNLVFNSSEWRISTTEYTCTPSVVDIVSFDSTYNVLRIGVSFSGQKKAHIRIQFLGNSEYYSQSDFDLVYVQFTKAKATPNYTFTESFIRTDGQPGGKYKLPNLIGVPSSLDISFSTSTYQATVVDGYLYYQGDGYVKVTASNIETSEYQSYSTYVEYDITGVYEKWDPQIFFKDADTHYSPKRIIQPYNDTNNYIVELDCPNYVDKEDINWNEVYFMFDRGGTAVYQGNQKYKISFDNNVYGTQMISFSLRETDIYSSCTDSCAFEIEQIVKQNLTYTLHNDYEYTNATLGETIRDVVLLTYEDLDGNVLKGTEPLFEVEVVPNNNYRYIAVSNVRYTGGEVKVDITLWNRSNSGSNDIYIKYNGNVYYNSRQSIGPVNFSFNVNSQYVRENVIYFDEQIISVEQNVQSDGYYDVQEVKHTYNIPVQPAYRFEEPNIIYNNGYKIQAETIGEYTVTAYTQDSVIDGVLYKATRIQYTFILTRDNNYYEDGSISFTNSSETVVQSPLNQYPLQSLTNPNGWTIEYTAVPAVGEEFDITDGYIHYNDVGVITIYARTDDVYPKKQAHYTLLISEDIGLDTGLSFPLGDVNYGISERYTINKPDNPNNLNYTLSSSSGVLTQSSGKYYLTGDFYVNDVITIYCYYPGDSVYKSTYISYRITITSGIGSVNLPVYIPQESSYINKSMMYTDNNLLSIFSIPQGTEYNYSGNHSQNDWQITNKNGDYSFSILLSGNGSDYCSMDLNRITPTSGKYYNCDYILPLSVEFKGTSIYGPKTFDYNIYIQEGDTDVAIGGPYFNSYNTVFAYDSSGKYDISSYLGDNIINPNKLSYTLSPSAGNSLNNGILNTYGNTGTIYMYNNSSYMWDDNSYSGVWNNRLKDHILRLNIQKRVFNSADIISPVYVKYNETGEYNLRYKLDTTPFNYINTDGQTVRPVLRYTPNGEYIVYDSNGNKITNNSSNPAVTFRFDENTYVLTTKGQFPTTGNQYDSNTVGNRFILYPLFVDSTHYELSTRKYPVQIIITE